MTKKDFITSLISQANESIWKYELAIEFNKDKKDAKSQEQLKAAMFNIERDREYIAFLTEQLEKCK